MSIKSSHEHVHSSGKIQLLLLGLRDSRKHGSHDRAFTFQFPHKRKRQLKISFLLKFTWHARAWNSTQWRASVRFPSAALMEVVGYLPVGSHDEKKATTVRACHGERQHSPNCIQPMFNAIECRKGHLLWGSSQDPAPQELRTGDDRSVSYEQRESTGGVRRKPQRLTYWRVTSYFYGCLRLPVN